MSLSGSLGFVPVDEVLRLLTRAGQQGSVDVSGVGFYGRIYVGSNGIDLATTHDDDVLHTQFINSRLVDEAALRRVAMGETTLAATADGSDEVQELIREITIEALYQISQHGSDFNVRADATTEYASPKSFDLESLLHDVRTRTKDWEKVSELIDDLEQPLVLNRDIGEREEVKMQVNDWKVLSEIGSGASVAAIAERLGTTRFWTARVAARLVGNELVQVSEGPVEAPQVDVYETPIDDAFAPFGRTEEPCTKKKPPLWQLGILQLFTRLRQQRSKTTTRSTPRSRPMRCHSRAKSHRAISWARASLNPRIPLSPLQQSHLIGGARASPSRNQWRMVTRPPTKRVTNSSHRTPTQMPLTPILSRRSRN